MRYRASSLSIGLINITLLFAVYFRSIEGHRCLHRYQNWINGRCVCQSGYLMGSSGHCIPVCQGDCPPNTRCLAPNQCYPDGNTTQLQTPIHNEIQNVKENSCTVGFALGPDNVCHPVCVNGCKNGRCEAPGLCVCYAGYKVNRNTTDNECQAFCDLKCVNGYCTGPNVCSCNPGYILRPGTYNLCEVYCPLGCPINSDCTAQYVCKCKPGFVVRNGVCVFSGVYPTATTKKPSTPPTVSTAVTVAPLITEPNETTKPVDNDPEGDGIGIGLDVRVGE